MQGELGIAFPTAVNDRQVVWEWLVQKDSGRNMIPGFGRSSAIDAEPGKAGIGEEVFWIHAV